MEEKLELVQLFLSGNMTAKGRRCVDGSFRNLIEFNTTKKDFYFSFTLKFSTEKSSSPVGRSEKYMETCFSSNVTGGTPVGYRH